MIIQWEGRDWPVDFSDLTMRQAETIEKFTSQSIGEWMDNFSGKFDIKSPEFLRILKVVYWLMLNQNGDPTPIETADFPLVKFSQAFIAGAGATTEVTEQAQEAPAIPPVPAPATISPGPSTQTAGTNGAVPAAYRSAQG